MVLATPSPPLRRPSSLDARASIHAACNRRDNYSANWPEKSRQSGIRIRIVIYSGRVFARLRDARASTGGKTRKRAAYAIDQPRENLLSDYYPSYHRLCFLFSSFFSSFSPERITPATESRFSSFRANRPCAYPIHLGRENERSLR